MNTRVGLAIVAAHVIGFVALAEECRGHDLVVRVHAKTAAPALQVLGEMGPEIRERVVVTDDDAPPGPGLHRRKWSVAYRGGYTRSVGAAQLVGPFQDPAARACSGRVIVSQRMLEDVAVQMRGVLEAEMAGQSITGAGDYTKIDSIELRWSRLEWHPEDRAMVRAAPNGYVRAAVVIAFERVKVPVVIALVPEPTPTDFTFRIASRAELAFGNRVAQWVSDRIGGNALATRLAKDQIDGALLSTLAPPPPFDLGNGHTLTFTYCADAPEIIEGTSGAVPFAVAITRFDRDPLILPPRRGPAPHTGVAKDAQLAIDLDVDALNAVLYELWRSGFLDAQLAAAGLDQRFNADPTVQELLSLRISPVRLALPPVIAPVGDRLRLSADARVTIVDGAAQTTGRVWGGLDFGLRVQPQAIDAPHARGIEIAALDVRLGALELSCERDPTTLVPCYSDLVSVIAGRGDDFHGALTDAFAKILSDIFVERRLGASGLPADILIKSAVPRVTASAGNASLHLDLAASLVPAVH